METECPPHLWKLVERYYRKEIDQYDKTSYERSYTLRILECSKCYLRKEEWEYEK